MEESNIVNKELNDSSFSLLDVIRIFLKNRKKIFLITGIICVLSIILYFFVLDLIYESTATIRTSNQASGLLGALDIGIPDIGGLDDLGLGGSGKSGKELAAYEEILSSRRCIEVVVNKFNLVERDEHRFYEDAIKNFRDEKLQISIDKPAGILKVGVLDKNPVFAKEMVETLLAELDKINIELNVTNAKTNREFIERRYFLAKSDLAKTEDSLKSYQQIYGISPDLQIKASAQSVFTLEAELKAEEVKLDVTKKILSVDQPEVKLQEAKVKSLRSKISEINTSTDLNDFIRLGNSPQIILQYLRLQRDVEIQYKILAFVLPLYEQAKIEENRNTPTILILDKPYVAERKSKPKRLTMVVVLTFAGFFLSISFFIVKYKWNIFKNNLQQSK